MESIVNDPAEGARPAARGHPGRSGAPSTRGRVGNHSPNRPPQRVLPSCSARSFIHQQSRALSKHILETPHGAGKLGGEGSREQEVKTVCSVLLVRVLQTDGQGCGLGVWGARGVSGLPGGLMHPPVSLSPPEAVAGDVTCASCSRPQLSHGREGPSGFLCLGRLRKGLPGGNGLSPDPAALSLSRLLATRAAGQCLAVYTLSLGLLSVTP